VVDDSAVARRVISELLAEDPGVEVAGTASHGGLGLAKIPTLKPDVVTLDLEMPEMGGLETLDVLRREHPSLPVIVLSAHTERGAAVTLESLHRGARDYVTKPTGLGAAESGRALRDLQAQLLARVKLFAPPARGSARPAAAPPPAAPRPAPPGPASPPRLVVVGASTGGPNALAEFLGGFQGTLPVPLLIAQHMPPLFTRALAERLAERSGLPVAEAVDGDPALPGRVAVAPGDFHLEVRRESAGPRLRVHRSPPENGCRPAVDVLFRSAADAYGGAVLGVVLTGMGHDGLKGGERIRAEGGRLLVQDEASSIVWGMPGSVARAGWADDALPPVWLAREVLRRIRGGGR
jgi:two-component system chemotaxis response regulator CheB